MSDVKLFINGKVYEDWTNVSIKNAINALSGHFSLSIVKPQEGFGKALGIKPNDECKVSVNGDFVVTGYVDSVSASIAADQVGLSFTGRHKTADLVDCSYKGNVYSWNDINAFTLIKKLCAPFNILPVSSKRFPILKEFSVSPGETVWEIISKLIKLTGFIVYADGDGHLIITDVAERKNSASIEQNLNMITANVAFDGNDRFSDYFVTGQSSTDDFLNSEDANQAFGMAKDKYVSRYRPIVIEADTETDSGGAAGIAQWEATRRAAESTSIDVTVPGWVNSEGDIWKVNEEVRLVCDYFNFNGLALVSEVEFVKDEGSEVCKMKLENINAYLKRPLIKNGDFWEMLEATP